MKQKTKWKIIVLLLMLCIVLLLSTFVLNNDFSATAVSADSTTSSIEDDLTFNLFKNGTECKVTARNRQITEVKIPETYNGIPVTEIADNAFTNCTNLQYVWIPYTVKRIGNNAFTNCRNLERINGMPKVESIGNNAFAMCLKLDNLILPNSINTLGSTILRNNPNTVYSRMTEEKIVALNSNWKAVNDKTNVIYGNQIVLDNVYDENDQLIGYSIGQSQCFSSDIDVVIGDTFNGKPLLEIEQGAFYYNQFRSFTLLHGEIVLDIDAANNKNFEPNADECKHTVNIASEAFYGLITDYIDLLVDVTFDDFTATTGSDYEVGCSQNVFAWSSARKITLPNNINIIPKSAFASCEQLREICNTDPNVEVNHLSNKITTICSEAFISCKSLLNLYVPSVINMGNAVFSQWGDPKFNDLKQVVHFEDLYKAPVGKDGYNWDSKWIGTQYENAKVQFKTLKVILDKDYDNDGDVEDVGTKSVDVVLDQAMPEEGVVAPQREYFTFEGYYSKRKGEGDQYYDKNMKSVNTWGIEGDGVLYAYWVGLPYEITFNKNGGQGGSDKVTANYMADMPEATAPINPGYIFNGYFYEPKGENQKYYDENMRSVTPWDKTKASELVADWTNKIYKVNLRHGDKEDTVEATFNMPMPPANKPSSAGWTFHGYFTEENGQGIKYYNADMTSARNWDIDQKDIVLYAHLTQTPYTLTFDMQGGEGGTDSYSYIHYNDSLPVDVTAPTRKGYKFLGYFDLPQEEGREEYKKYYNADMTSSYYYDVDDYLTIYAHWEIIEYNINYPDLPDNIVNPNPTTYTIVELPINIVSFDSAGYRTTFDLNNIPENTIGDIDVHSTTTAIEYQITYNLNGGTSKGDNPDFYTVENRFTLKNAVHETLFFDGWTLDGNIIKNLDGLYRDITLEATWTDIMKIKLLYPNGSFNLTYPKVMIIIHSDTTGLVPPSGNEESLLITVNSTVESLTVSGGRGVCEASIQVLDRKIPFSLYLENISLKAPVSRSVIEAGAKTELNLYTSGYVSIVGNAYMPEIMFSTDYAYSGMPAISCGKLNIQAADNLYIKGGDGFDGKNGTNEAGKYNGQHGGCGGMAIALSGDCYINCSNVTLCAGSAGNGGNAYNSSSYRGKGGAGAIPIGKNAISDSVRVYVKSGTQNIKAYKTPDGRDGIGLNPTPQFGGGNDTMVPPDYLVNFPPIDYYIDPGVIGGGI